MTFLADTSAVWRMLHGRIGTPWTDRLFQGLIAISAPVESELMLTVRRKSDYEPFFKKLDGTFAWCPPLGNPWPQVLAVQRDLLEIGHHRGPSPMDILIALTARRHGLTLVHVDGDFASIAKVRPDIPMIRLEEQDA